MNEQAKENETTNSRGGTVERRVETVDYRSSAGQGQEERKVEVIHMHHSNNTSGGVLAGAAAAVSSTLQSAKDAISKK